jgi:hypothetical protein
MRYGIMAGEIEKLAQSGQYLSIMNKRSFLSGKTVKGISLMKFGRFVAVIEDSEEKIKSALKKSKVPFYPFSVLGDFSPENIENHLEDENE